MKLSPYQEKIVDFILHESGNATCNAVAGSGKSTTLRIVAQELEKSGLNPSEIRVIVFGKANSLDLINKFGTAWKSSISTLHSAGWTLIKEHLELKKTQGLIQNQKYKKIAEKLDLIGHKGNRYLGSLKREKIINRDDDFLKVCDFLRLTNLEPTQENVYEICSHFNVEDINDYSSVALNAKMVLYKGEYLAREGESFDFTDQIWLPVKWQLKPFKPYKFVLVDECQDLNAAQLELALSLAASDGRLLFVGDPRQAIMGFSGADNESYNKIVQRTNAIELPLSVCYRCPRSHVDLVKGLYRNIPIECFEGAIEGEIKQIKPNEINDYLKVGDLVLSRKTAPLVNLCIKLIAKGIAATVKGKAIGEQIKKDLEDIGKIFGFRYDEFNEYLLIYKESKARRYRGLDNEEKLLEDLKDKCEALKTIYESQINCKSIGDLGNYIDNLFSDDYSPITLSTAHRAKGLENDRVFLIKPEDMPLSWNRQKGWELEQEFNLHYVALTRAKSELFIVGNPPWLLDQEEETVAETVTPQTDNTNCDQTQTPINQMTNEEKRERVREAIQINPSLSARAIADSLGVSNKFVSKLKKQLIESGEIDSTTEVEDKRGRRLDTSNIGLNKPKIPLKKKVEAVVNEHRPDTEEIKDLIIWLQSLIVFPD